jgi:hypothetical protein
VKVFERFPAARNETGLGLCKKTAPGKSVLLGAMIY